MNQEEKELLLRDLCSRVPYKVKLQVEFNYGDNGHKEGIYDAELDSITDYNLEATYYDTNMNGLARDWTFMFEEVKPYLRSMSSMTKEEAEELDDVNGWHELGRRRCCYSRNGNYFFSGNNGTRNELYVGDLNRCYDWLNAHHFDYRGLIEKGLALEAPEGMYEI